MIEKQKHIDAFEIYFTFKQERLSKNKAFEETIKKIGVSKSSIKTWAREFDWDGREAIRSKEINKKVSEKTDDNIVDHKAMYLSFFHKLLNDLKNSGFDIKICNVNDLVKAVDMCLVLLDESDSHNVEVFNLSGFDPDELEIAKQIAQGIAKHKTY